MPENNFITREECALRHAPMDEFRQETNENFTRMHTRMDGITKLIIGTLCTIIGALIIQLAVKAWSDSKPTQQPKIEITIDKNAMQHAANP